MEKSIYENNRYPQQFVHALLENKIFSIRNKKDFRENWTSST
jgi:hypothetical protein